MSTAVDNLIELEAGRESVTQDMIDYYQHNGFVKVPNLLTRDCAYAFREEAIRVASASRSESAYAQRLTQQVNVWRTNEILKEIVFSPVIASIAESLAGADLRLWHDHLLSKRPKNGQATEWHQDQPYWPFADKPKTISVWIALQDTPAELGCMNFIPESHHLTNLESQNLSDARSLFSKAADLEFAPKVKLPLRAGDATFHNGLCGHMATPNTLDEWRCAMVTIYMEDGTRLADKKHVVIENYRTDVGQLEPGTTLDQNWFPRLALG